MIKKLKQSIIVQMSLLKKLCALIILNIGHFKPVLGKRTGIGSPDGIQLRT
jgi:hypothetical protein